MEKKLNNPEWVEQIVEQYTTNNAVKRFEMAKSLSHKLERFYWASSPDVSIVIPAFNEEESILLTLASIAATHSTKKIELIVVNNNSTDSTNELLDAAGVMVAFQPEPSISMTRQLGVQLATGKIILNADADTIYPPDWIDQMTDPLSNPNTSLVYGDYRYIANNPKQRQSLDVANQLSMIMRRLREQKRPYLNVMGFNFAFRLSDALAIGGFDVSKPRWSDGRIALSLSEVGQLVRCNPKVVPYTYPRRLEKDGSIAKALWRRIKKELKWLPQHLGIIKPQTPVTR